MKRPHRDRKPLTAEEVAHLTGDPNDVPDPDEPASKADVAEVWLARLRDQLKPRDDKPGR